MIAPDKQVESTCPYCGVGCLLKDDTILYVDGRNGPANRGRLLDPYGKIPEFKYCAVRVLPVLGDRELSWAAVG